MMKKISWFIGIILFLMILGKTPEVFALSQKVFDGANILSENEAKELESLANEIGSKWDTDILIVTVDDPSIDVKQYTEDFYDEKIEEQGLNKWNVAMITLDMYNREVYLAGFYKGKLYLNDSRLNKIRDEITPALSGGNYGFAFQQFIESVDHYMDGEPANIFLRWWFQLIIASILGGIVVFSFVYTSGGRITVNNRTYLDEKTSRVIDSRDDYIRTTVTKVKKPSSNSSGGGGGGITGGGHSHSGSRGSF